MNENTWLDVSMKVAMRVHVRQALEDLVDDTPDAGL